MTQLPARIDDLPASLVDVAEALGLRVASKPDSHDICFIPDGDYVRFLR